MALSIRYCQTLYKHAPYSARRPIKTACRKTPYVTSDFCTAICHGQVSVSQRRFSGCNNIVFKSNASSCGKTHNASLLNQLLMLFIVASFQLRRPRCASLSPVQKWPKISALILWDGAYNNSLLLIWACMFIRRDPNWLVAGSFLVQASPSGRYLYLVDVYLCPQG